MNSSPHDPAAEEQAALWATRLDGSDLDAADRAELSAWLSAHPSHRTLLSEYCQFSANLEVVLPDVVAAGNVAMPIVPPKPRRQFFTWMLGTGLAAAAAVAVGLFVWQGSAGTQQESFATAVAQRRTLELRDGSKIELNAQTSVVVDLSKTERRVRLAAGEAFFTVAKDPSRPFIVDTPTGSVRVTGTVFNVRSQAASHFEVTVVEGSVQVTPGALGNGPAAAPVALKAGGRLSLSAAAPVQFSAALPSDEVEDLIAWREGYLVFKGAPLAEALARIGRIHGRSIKAAPEVANKPLGGRFKAYDLNEFFTALEVSLGVQVRHDTSGNTVISARETK